jgi:SAM-dependent methyltransferase
MPTHVPQWIPEDVGTPAIMHYHNAVTPTGLLAKVGFPAIDGQIEICNNALVQLWSHSFPNVTFWEWRYRSHPELGSGVGSRGTSLNEKRQMLVNVLNMIRPNSTLDVGSGDAEATRGLAIPNYTGIDLSNEAIRLASAARPLDTFHVGTLVDYPLEADLTICQDVLIHQSDEPTYRDLVRRLLLSARRALLISGYEQEPQGDRTMTHHHEPLSDTIRRLAPEAAMSLMRVENETTTWLVDTSQLERSANSP